MLLLEYMKRDYATPAVEYLAESLGMDDADALDRLSGLLDGKKMDLERKNALLEREAEILLTPEQMASRLSTLNDEEMALFERACKGPVNLGAEERITGHEVQGCRYAFLVPDEDDEIPIPDEESADEDTWEFLELMRSMKRMTNHVLEVPEDVVTLYNSMNTPEFRVRRRRAFQLTRCLDVCRCLYVTTPVSVVRRMMEQELGEDISEEEILSLFRSLPRDAVFCIYDSDTGRIARRNIKEERLAELIQKQAGGDFYIPRPEEVEALYRKEWIDTPAYARYTDFLQKHADFSPMDMDEAAGDLWQCICEEKPPQENLQKMIMWSNADYTLSKLMMTLYRACLNETRFPAYCGHTIPEMQAADPDFQTDYFPDKQYDLKFESGTNTTRVRRNDPCPCGSGKKFKKCCMY